MRAGEIVDLMDGLMDSRGRRSSPGPDPGAGRCRGVKPRMDVAPQVRQRFFQGQNEYSINAYVA